MAEDAHVLAGATGRDLARAHRWSPTSCGAARSATSSRTSSIATSTSPTSASSTAASARSAATTARRKATSCPIDEVVRRAREAWDLGATRGLHPGRAAAQAGRALLHRPHPRAQGAPLPELHLHAFSPEEVLYGSVRSGLSDQGLPAELKAAGLGTLPGTSAEILDQAIRDVIARGRITVDQWVEVITTAHALGIRTTSTIMYGHVETAEHWVRHMALLRAIQKDTGGFTEFVPLSLIHSEAPMYSKRLVPGRAARRHRRRGDPHARARPGDARDRAFRNIQASWVKEGPKLAQALLDAGANDLGGTLINESISTSAGAQYGQLVGARRAAALDPRRRARARPARHALRHRAACTRRATIPRSPLDAVEDAEARFGSYRRLIASGEFRFTPR